MRTKLLLMTAAAAVTLMVPGGSAAHAQPIPCLLPGVGDCPAPVPIPLPTPAPVPSGECAHATEVPAAGKLDDAREAVLCLLNKERSKRDLGKLSASPALEGAATSFSRSMVIRDFFAHVSPSGSTVVDRIKRTSYLDKASSWALGENIAWGSGSLSTPAKTVNAWMHSTAHKRNILTPRFDHVGVGIALGAPLRIPAGQPAATYTTDFGAR